MFSSDKSIFQPSFGSLSKTAAPGSKCSTLNVAVRGNSVSFVVADDVTWCGFLSLLANHVETGNICVDVVLNGNKVEISPEQLLKHALKLGPHRTQSTVVLNFARLQPRGSSTLCAHIVDISMMNTPFGGSVQFTLDDSNETPSLYDYNNLYPCSIARECDSGLHSLDNNELHKMRNILTRLLESNGNVNIHQPVKKEVPDVGPAIEEIKRNLEKLTGDVETITLRTGDALTFISTLSEVCAGMFEKVISLEGQLDAIKNTLNFEDQKCAICMENPKKIALVPCGHVFCPGCTGGILKTHKCPSCRTLIKSTCTLYF